MKILILNHAEIEQLLPMKNCIDVITEAFIALAHSQVHLPLRMIVRPTDAKGLLGLMPAYVSGERAMFGIKIIGVFGGNPAIGKDSHQGAVLLISGETGEPLALMNASAITAIRTAATSGVATKLLAREDASELAIIGSGIQARTHLAAMACVRSIKRARITSRSFDHAQQFVAETRGLYPFPVEAVKTVEAAVDHADLIVTVTSSSEPVLKREWVSAGAHINAIGSSVAQAREIESALMAAASLFVDRRESTLNESGDYLFAMREGAIGPDNIRAEIGEVLIGTKSGRSSIEEITLFKSLGLAIEDLAAAEYTYRQAQASNSGTWVEF
jgi:ornithine cyclodeaminase